MREILEGCQSIYDFYAKIFFFFALVHREKCDGWKDGKASTTCSMPGAEMSPKSSEFLVLIFH